MKKCFIYYKKRVEKGYEKMYNYVKNCKIKRITYMKPRIFISSTFYDLKYIREDLANFVRSYGYEPVLFEDGDIGYTPGKTLDKSCYDSMKNSDMVILIIGGEYGSAASGEKKDGFEEYISITRNEFRTAIENGIPVFTMIDKKVMTEYGVYDANYDSIEKENRVMTFPTTKSINVFRFIKEIKGIVTLPIQEFERSSDIKGFISKQWADMFKNYLSSLRNEKENKKIENSINELQLLIQKMDIMLESVGKNVLSKENPEEYKNVVNQQEVVSFCNDFVETFDFVIYNEINTSKERKKFIEILLNFLNKVQNIQEFTDGVFAELHPYILKRVGQSKLIDIKHVCEILQNEEYFNASINILSKDKYFYRLVFCENDNS